MHTSNVSSHVPLVIHTNVLAGGRAGLPRPAASGMACRASPRWHALVRFPARLTERSRLSTHDSRRQHARERTPLPIGTLAHTWEMAEGPPSPRGAICRVAGAGQWWKGSALLPWTIPGPQLLARREVPRVYGLACARLCWRAGDMLANVAGSSSRDPRPPLVYAGARLWTLACA